MARNYRGGKARALSGERGHWERQRTLVASTEARHGGFWERELGAKIKKAEDFSSALFRLVPSPRYFAKVMLTAAA
jgi:hypothetical protein